MNRWKNLKKLLRMDGSISDLIGTWLFALGGFFIGIILGRLILTLF